MTPESINHEVTLRVNGVAVETLGPKDLGKPILLPLAPNDQVEMVADDGTHRLLLQKHVDKQEAGDFIAYYTFQAGSGTTVYDRSSNDNDATIHGGTTWVNDSSGTALAFDGSSGYAKVDQLVTKHVRDVKAFTVAVKYRVDGDTGDIQQLVEHRNDTTNFEWFLETKSGNVPYRVHYSVWPNGVAQDGVTTGSLGAGETHVVVGTYDGHTLELYRDGTLVGTKSVSDTVEMGALFIGADATAASSQFLDGRIYQLRLYYTDMDGKDVKTLTKLMNAEAE